MLDLRQTTENDQGNQEDDVNPVEEGSHDEDQHSPSGARELS